MARQNRDRFLYLRISEHPQLGKVRDSTLARQLRCSASYVALVRKRQGLLPTQAGPIDRVVADMQRVREDPAFLDFSVNSAALAEKLKITVDIVRRVRREAVPGQSLRRAAALPRAGSGRREGTASKEIMADPDFFNLQISSLTLAKRHKITRQLVSQLRVKAGLSVLGRDPTPEARRALLDEVRLRRSREAKECNAACAADPGLGIEPDEVVAARLGVSVSRVSIVRRQLKRPPAPRAPSKVARTRDLLLAQPDLHTASMVELARRCGTTPAYVWQIRSGWYNRRLDGLRKKPSSG